METRQDRATQQRHGEYGRSQESIEVFRRRELEGWNGQGQGILGNGNEARLAQGLGLFSIALGMAALAAPRSLARLIGVEERRTLLRLLGMREIASGIGILTQRRPAGWLRTRVGGDIMDLALLGIAFTEKHAQPARLAAATAAVVGVTALDVWCSQQLSQDVGSATDKDRGVCVKKTIIVNRSPQDLYNYWHDFQNLPRFLKNLESVELTGAGRSHWVAKGPAGKKVQWDAEIVEDRPNECIAWRSVEGADVPNSGAVRFERASGGRGSLVRVEMQYRPPAGTIGATVAKLFGRAPEQEIEEDLRRFKQVMETGEIITTEGQPAGRAGSTSWKYDRTVRRASSTVSG